MTTSAPAVSAAIYCRISLADEGDFTKVEDQERICRDIAAQRGWKLADDIGYPEPNGVFTDNSRSAWKRNVRRPGWEAMLAAVEAGTITAIVAYHGDRLARQPRDLEKLIDLAEGKGIRLASSLGDFNLDASQDRIFARVIAAFAEGESARTSERRKAQYERWRREGRTRPGGTGGRPFGFETDGITHRPADRCALATRQEAGEPDALREMAARILAGDSASSVAASLNARGWRTAAGSLFTHHSVRRLLSRARYAGLMPDGISVAAWEPVIGRADWEAVNAILSARAAGHSYATNTRRYLLSGIALCGVCGAPLSKRAGQKAKDGPIVIGYSCKAPGCGKVYRSQPLLDAYVTGAVVRRLGHEANPAPRVPADPGLAAELAALTLSRAEAEALIADYKGGSARLLLARLDSIDERIGQLRSLAAGDARGRLIRAHAGISREEFESLPLAARRSLVAACFTVEVLPASQRGPGFRTEDVRLTQS